MNRLPVKWRHPPIGISCWWVNTVSRFVEYESCRAHRESFSVCLLFYVPSPSHTSTFAHTHTHTHTHKNKNKWFTHTHTHTQINKNITHTHILTALPSWSTTAISSVCWGWIYSWWCGSLSLPDLHNTHTAKVLLVQPGCGEIRDTTLHQPERIQCQ